MATGLAEITVAGALPVPWRPWLRARGVRAMRRQTVLQGSVPDGAALPTLLEQAHDLGLGVSVLWQESRRDTSGGVAVRLVVDGGVGDVLLSMLDQLRDGDRVPCTTLAVRTGAVDDVARWLTEHGRVVLGTVHPLPPEAGDARAPAGAQGGVAVDPPHGWGTGDEHGPDEEADVEADVDVTEELGPIDYLVVEFPQNKLDGTAFPLLVDLVDRGIIRVLDLAFVEKDADGQVHAIELHEAASGEVDLSFFEGASSGLLGDDDIAEAAQALENGSAAGILVFENRWAAPFAAALRRGGGQLVASGRIPVQAILAALDDLDAA
ncbi:DUF6325 family protein [Cellulomonas fimi]|uniref:DUF1269 domain-containing protein n=1 Tax=Cellulomonas fimi (strain ATCC 484 / DSM 20113 / JCM 1341 / CCUG 24087 / LMG 16345 / NBRC 15513 / NCIMB 8980 / NCTC 7547 / NRS-133) TaxID=590998 RepID=F4H0Y0_CELFA|nr:DUF6325 family protein [Cellulomonas fimi]AEE46227.1 hypothetical protein Celf_2099 [Cellulomonas fimi ATCC 484]VEH32142.1 Uncharacterised protein [Cellulomonas fimi]